VLAKGPSSHPAAIASSTAGGGIAFDDE